MIHSLPKSRAFISTLVGALIVWVLSGSVRMPADGPAIIATGDHAAMNEIAPTPALPLAATLNSFELPSEDSLWAEVGITPDQNRDKLYKDLVASFMNSGSRRQRAHVTARCEDKLSTVTDPYVVSPTTLECLPVSLSASQDEVEPRRSAPQTALRRIRGPQDWDQLRDRSFRESMRLIEPKNLSEANALADAVTNNSSNCAFRNAGAALISDVEEWLPKPEAWNILQRVYAGTVTCLAPSDDAYERTHLRMGLFFLIHNQLDDAERALQASLLAVTPDEDYRALYWLGDIFESRQVGPHKKGWENPFWNSLRSKHPLGFHAILSAHRQERDPMEHLVTASRPEFTRRNQTADGHRFNAATFVLEMLLARKEMRTAQHWADFIERHRPTKKQEELLYLGLLANKAGAYRASISFLASFLSKSKYSAVDKDFLNLYFPQPFLDSVVQKGRDVDPCLLMGLIRQESAFNHEARSGAGALGLMQIMPRTARTLSRKGARLLTQPDISVDLGTQYFSKMMNRFNGRVVRVLAAYNAGPTVVRRWEDRYASASSDLLMADLLPYQETRLYVALILRNTYWYSRLFAAAQDELTIRAMEKSKEARLRSELIESLLDQIRLWDSQRLAFNP